MNDQQLVTLYVDGELNGEELDGFEARLAHEPELLAQVEAQLALSELITEGLNAQDLPSLDGFTERVMSSLPERAPLSTPTSEASSSAVEGEARGLKAWFERHISALLLGAAVAAALLIGLRLLQPSAPHPTQQPSTVLINLEQPKAEGAAPVIWLSDDEEDSGSDAGAEGGADDNPI
jgi:anti-sigma factor RsiW